MICKYCGRLVTSKSQCLCCGSAVSKKSSAKLTPKQLEEYELSVKQREEARLKEEQERIAREEARIQRNKKIAATVTSFVGIGLAALVVILMIIKIVAFNTITIKNFKTAETLGYRSGEAALVISFVAAATLLIASRLKKKSGGKKHFIWAIVGILCVPIGFFTVINGNGELYCSLQVEGIKTEYVVGEQLDLSGLKLEAHWDNGGIEEIDLDDYEIVIEGAGENIDKDDTGKIYISGFDSSKTTQSYGRTIYFEITIYFDEYPDGTGGYGQSANGQITYYVTNA